MTEDRLARVEQQLKTTRQLVAILLVALLALGGLLAYGQLRPKRNIILQDGDATLSLEPSQLSIHTARGEVVISASEIRLDSQAEPRSDARLRAGGLTLSSLTGPMVSASATTDEATIDLSTQFGSARLHVDKEWSLATVDRKAGPSVDISTNDKISEVSGKGGNAFDLGGPARP